MSKHICAEAGTPIVLACTCGRGGEWARGCDSAKKLIIYTCAIMCKQRVLAHATQMSYTTQGQCRACALVSDKCFSGRLFVDPFVH